MRKYLNGIEGKGPRGRQRRVYLWMHLGRITWSQHSSSGLQRTECSTRH